MILFKDVTISLILIPILYIIIPDTDLRFNSHRNVFLHSLLIPIIVLIFNLSLLTILIILSFGLHCLCDISVLKKKGGAFTIKYFGMKSIGGFWFAEVWLILNFVVSLIIFIIYLMVI